MSGGFWNRALNRSRRRPRLVRSALTRTGWAIAGGGETTIVDAPPEFRGPSVQVTGLYPFSAGSTLPMIGAALGPHLGGRGILCADLVAWFAAGLINNPSCFVLGRPGVGKSTLVRHMLIQLPDKGVIPLVLSDFKGEYVDLIRELDGKVVAPGRGVAYVNPLDLGPLWQRLMELPETMTGRDGRTRHPRAEARADMEGRRANVMIGLCELALGGRLAAHEANILVAAIRYWQDRHPTDIPVVRDVLEVVQERPRELQLIAQDRGDKTRYAERTERLVDALLALSSDEGMFGGIFAHHTTEPMEMGRPFCFDLQSVDAADRTVQAGLQLVCWSYGSAAVTASKHLSDAGLQPRQVYVLDYDELWRSLRAAEFMVDRIDDLTRLNRTLGLAQILITHTMADLKLPTPDATEKAWGFVSRSEMVFMGGLDHKEMGNLAEVFAMSAREQTMVTSWSARGTVNPKTGKADAPPGRGKFLLKTGQDLGLPFRVQLVDAEIALNDTNRTWHDAIASMNRGGGSYDELIDEAV